MSNSVVLGNNPSLSVTYTFNETHQMYNYGYTWLDSVTFEPKLMKEVGGKLLPLNPADFVALRTWMHEEVAKRKFIYFEPVVNTLLYGYIAKEHVVLYGPGGHGKSELTELVFNLLGLSDAVGHETNKCFIKSFNASSGPSDLMGPTDLEALKNNKLRHVIEEGIANYQYCVLEEGFDMAPTAISSLKDLLTSGFVRNGTQQVPSKIKFIVICTNWSKEQLNSGGIKGGDTAASAALYERFANWLEVKWPSYGKEDFEKLFTAHFGTSIYEIAELCKLSYGSKFPISPRLAVKIAKMWLLFNQDFDVLNAMVPQELLKPWKKTFIHMQESSFFNSEVVKIEAEIKTLVEAINAETRKGAGVIREYNTKLKEITAMHRGLTTGTKLNEAQVAKISELNGTLAKVGDLLLKFS